MRHVQIVRPLILAFALTACGGRQSNNESNRPVAAEPVGLEHWSEHHPDASRDLGEWVRANPGAARAIFEWDATNGEHAQAFVRWVAMRPDGTLEQFISEHPELHGFDNWAGEHHAATVAFMVWVRHYPQAAQALMEHRGGLAWAGHHVYSEYAHLEHPEEADAAATAASADASAAPSMASSDAGSVETTASPDAGAATTASAVPAGGAADAGAAHHGHGRGH